MSGHNYRYFDTFQTLDFQKVSALDYPSIQLHLGGVDMLTKQEKDDNRQLIECMRQRYAFLYEQRQKRLKGITPQVSKAPPKVQKSKSNFNVTDKLRNFKSFISKAWDSAQETFKKGIIKKPQKLTLSKEIQQQQESLKELSKEEAEGKKAD